MNEKTNYLLSWASKGWSTRVLSVVTSMDEEEMLEYVYKRYSKELRCVEDICIVDHTSVSDDISITSTEICE